MILRIVAILFVVPLLVILPIQAQPTAQPKIQFHADLRSAQVEAKNTGVCVFVLLVSGPATPSFIDGRIVERSRGFSCVALPKTSPAAKKLAEEDSRVIFLDSAGEKMSSLGGDLQTEQLWLEMRKIEQSKREELLAILKPDADSDVKAKRAAFNGLVRLRVGTADLIPHLASPIPEIKAQAKKVILSKPAEESAAALLDAVAADNAEIQAAAYPLAVQMTGYRKAPTLKAFQELKDEARTEALEKWRNAMMLSVYRINSIVLAFCEKRMGTQVNNGECAMMVVDAYGEAKAKAMYHSGPTYIWGRELRPGEPVLPGDVVQYEKCRFEFERGWSETPHHTSLIRKVLEKDTFEILEQNVGGVRKVQPGKLQLANRVRGTVAIYRPR